MSFLSVKSFKYDLIQAISFEKHMFSFKDMKCENENDKANHIMTLFLFFVQPTWIQKK